MKSTSLVIGIVIFFYGLCSVTIAPIVSNTDYKTASALIMTGLELISTGAVVVLFGFMSE
jgi:hypothetical protein